MDPFERQFRKRANIEGFIALFVGIVIAYVIQNSLAFRGGNLFTALIVLAVGGFWYHIRRVV